MKPNQAFSMFRINCWLAEGRKGWRFIAAVFLALLSFSANPGLDLIFADGFEGCGFDSWSSATTFGSNVIFIEPPGGVPRLDGECVMRATGIGYVQSDHPIHSRIRIRFYFFAEVSGGGTAQILSAYNDEAGASPLFNISLQNISADTSIVFDTSTAGGGSSPPIEFSEECWHLVEVDWDAVTGSSSIWVDKDATSAVPDAIFSSGSGFVESVSLGLPNGLGALSDVIIFFDAFESRNTTAIGPVPGTGDPDSDCDGISDFWDRLPNDDSNAHCTTNDGTNATLVGETISAEQTTCASGETVDVSGNTEVGIGGDLLLIAPAVSLTDMAVTGNGRMEVINADPCEGCTPP